MLQKLWLAFRNQLQTTLDKWKITHKPRKSNIPKDALFEYLAFLEEQATKVEAPEMDEIRQRLNR